MKVWKSSSSVVALPGEELDVVEEEDVRVQQALTDLVHPVEADSGHDFLHEGLGIDVEDLLSRAAGEASVADRLHEVGLAETRRAADEEGVVAVGGLVGNVEGRGVGELVGLADDEVLERVEGIQVSDLGPCRGLRTGRRNRRPIVVLTFQDEADLAGPDAREAGRLSDLLAVFARDVVDEEGAADENVDSVGRLELLPGPAEPGVEVALVHPGLQVLENFLPGGRLVHGISTDVREGAPLGGAGGDASTRPAREGQGRAPSEPGGREEIAGLAVDRGRRVPENPPLALPAAGEVVS